MSDRGHAYRHGRRRHHHPDALWGVARSERHALAARGMGVVAGFLFFISLPWASLLLCHLVLGSDRTWRWLHGIGAGWLVPGFL